MPVYGRQFVAVLQNRTINIKKALHQHIFVNHGTHSISQSKKSDHFEDVYFISILLVKIAHLRHRSLH